MPENRSLKYQEDFPAQAEKLCSKFGATNADLADFFDVSVRTIERWAVQHQEFGAALRTGKEISDQRVERSLYQRALGMRVPAVRHFQHQGVVQAEEYEEYIPPDTKAAIFWLCNRMGDRWNNAHMKGAGRFDEGDLPESVRVEIIDGRADTDSPPG